MGTRALVEPMEDGKALVTIYRQFDGYPDGLGVDLANILTGHTLVNGFGGKDAEASQFNGMGCLAAQVVRHLKDSIGNVYIYPAGSRDVGEEYIYTIRPGFGDGQIEITIYEPNDTAMNGIEPIWSGTPEQLLAKYGRAPREVNL